MTPDIPRGPAAPHGPSRRQFLALGLGAFVVAGLPLAARRRERLVRRTLPVMGTVAEVAVLHDDVRHAHLAIDAAMAELQRLERTMTRFAATSDLGRANLGAARAPVAVSADTALVVAAALRWAEATDGAFDPAIGGAVALWDVTHRQAPPPEAAVKRLAGLRLHRQVELDRNHGTSVLRYHAPEVQLDLGAIGKGHAVDRAAAMLRDWGIGRALVNVGGDLYAVGTGPDGEAWRVGIQDPGAPGDPTALLGTVEVADAAIATSGTYAQYFRSEGRIYHHLLDPATGAPRRTLTRSLTVRADRCIDADAAATALFGMGRGEAAQVLARVAPEAVVLRTA